MTLLYITLATFVGGLLSVLIAASLTVAVLGRVVHHLVSLSAGVLLGTALLDILPEAFESKTASPQSLFATLLVGLLFFFLLEKAELYRHSHHHEGDEHHHHHGFDQQQAGRGGWSVILGDSIHNFCDGIIIAASFLADTRLGVVTSLAIIAHEIPQEVGDYIVLINAGFPRMRALFFNAVSGFAAVVGGVIGLLHRRAVGSVLSLPAGGRVEQLRLCGRRRPDPAVAASAEPARNARSTGVARGGARHRGRRGEPVARRLTNRQRTISTGTVECVSTFWVSLPSSSAETPRRPCEAITTRSHCMRRAWSMMASHGWSASTVCASQRRLCASACATTPCTCLRAMRSCASKNSCGGVGCISEIAL